MDNVKNVVSYQYMSCSFNYMLLTITDQLINSHHFLNMLLKLLINPHHRDIDKKEDVRYVHITICHLYMYI